MSNCTTISTTVTESPQRNPDGTFAKGNKGGPGNPFARETAEMRRVFAECCTQDDLIAIAHVLLEKARAGDMQAIKLVLSYRLGKPAPMKDPDRIELEEERRATKEAQLREKANQAAIKTQFTWLKETLDIAQRMEAEYEEEFYDEEDARADAPAVEASAGTAEPRGAALQGGVLERGNGSSSPLPNGFSPEQPPLPNGFFAGPPLPNGFFPRQRPLPNGFSSPSPNGFSEAKAPPPNPRTRAQMRAKRRKKEKRKRQKAGRRAARR